MDECRCAHGYVDGRGCSYCKIVRLNAEVERPTVERDEALGAAMRHPVTGHTPDCSVCFQDGTPMADFLVENESLKSQLKISKSYGKAREIAHERLQTTNEKLVAALEYCASFECDSTCSYPTGTKRCSSCCAREALASLQTEAGDCKAQEGETSA